jgi:opacity protein-like surface antigen
MRAFVAVCLCLAAALIAAPAAAQEAENLRRELEDMRRQFDQLRQRYEDMSERLRRLEAAPAPAPTPVAAPAPTPPAAPPAATPSLAELARPREPFALYERRGPGQLLFDIGVVGDFVGNITSSRAERAQTGTFAGRENRFFPREVELNFFGQVDPYAFAAVRIEAAEEFEDGERAIAVNLADAYLELTALPFGLGLKGGFMRTRFGLLNEFHREALPQTDQPNVLTRFFGEEGLRESGAELTWVAPLPVYLQGIVGVFNGDNEKAFGRASLHDPLVTARLRTFLELGAAGALQLGVSGATGETDLEKRASYLGFDAKYKYVPGGWSHPLLTVGGELIFAERKVLVSEDEAEDTQFQTRHPWGYYVYAEVQPWKRWILGLRYDWTEFPDDPGDEWAIGPYIAFRPSEFLRFRLGYKHTERSASSGVEPRTLDELLFQATFFLGAHPAHGF